MNLYKKVCRHHDLMSCMATARMSVDELQVRREQSLHMDAKHPGSHLFFINFLIENERCPGFQ